MFWRKKKQAEKPDFVEMQLSVCDDCFDVIHFEPSDIGERMTPERQAECRDAVQHLGGEFITDCQEPAFGWNACECCQSDLGGNRHSGVVLIPNNEESK
ncbi:hypothetical protein [uncultured Sulfitobacter sp.]|uniref:hypothetical protein n=1 Tax=uncultured Sulfitobacter sp. TaxID=191468 RepID=UPI00259651B5|nr:hypothetical protein [uncultured Sulfitobacter sp.]